MKWVNKQFGIKSLESWHTMNVKEQYYHSPLGTGVINPCWLATLYSPTGIAQGSADLETLTETQVKNDITRNYRFRSPWALGWR